MTMAPAATEATCELSTAIEHIRAVPSFANLSTEVACKMARAMLIEQVPAKTALIHEGQAQKWLFLVFQGLLQQFTFCGTHETTLAIFKAPLVVGIDAMTDDAVAPASVRTLRTCRLGRIGLEHARQLLKEEREFADAAIVEIGTRFRDLLRECKGARTRNGFERLVAWILAMQRDSATPHEIELPYDKSILAARLGITPATLSRDFARLVPLGVTVTARTMGIGDVRRLREVVQPDALNLPLVP
jgi:CRP-like cAMP-binding protein